MNHQRRTTTVEFVKSGKIVKHVKKLKLTPPEEENPDNDKPSMPWRVKQEVLVQDAGAHDVWQVATITRVHEAAHSVNVRYRDTGKVEKNVHVDRLGKSSRWARARLVCSCWSSPTWVKSQPVLFYDKDGVCRAGRIAVVHDANCDIEHDSDNDHVSENVPWAQITAKRWWHSWYIPPTRFQAQTRVEYMDAKGRWYMGTIEKRHRDNTYDIQQENESGKMALRVSAEDVRLVSPWSQCLRRSQQWLCGTLTVGTHVEVQLDDDDVWVPGVVQKVRTDGKYVVAYKQGDGSTTVVKVGKSRLRRPRRSWLNWLAVSTNSSFACEWRLRVSRTTKTGLESGRSLASTMMALLAYDNGRIDKHVLPSRLRDAVTALTIGTRVHVASLAGSPRVDMKVDVALESQQADVPTAIATEGVIVWVYRDYSGVALEVTDDLGEVATAPDISVAALHLNGEPISAMTLESHSTVRSAALVGNIVVETLVYLWFLFGLGGEMSQGIDVLALLDSAAVNATSLYTQQQFFVPNATMCRASRAAFDATTPNWQLKYKWLMALVVIKGTLLTISTIASGLLLLHNIQLLARRLVDLRLYAAQALWQQRLHQLMLMTLLCSSFVILAYGSMYNHFAYACLAPPVTLDAIRDAFKVAPFSAHPSYRNVVDLVPIAAATTVFNLYRGLWLLLVLVMAPDVVMRLCMALPMVAATAMVLSLGFASFRLFFETQSATMLQLHELDLTHYQNMAISLILAAAWFSFVLPLRNGTVRIRFLTTFNTGSIGSISDRHLKKAEKGAFGVRAQEEATWYRLDQLQLDTGVVATICIELVSGPIVVFQFGAVVWLLVGSVLLKQANFATAGATTITVIVSSMWLAVLTAAVLLMYGVKRQAWGALKKARRQERILPRGKQYQPRVILP
ncbi:hypothetical protein ACHHYP_08865 [Achlya hypogyna]|uniref:Agenet domain-containing protein n=1 Tax=Achlya hypogyna TaxID=1202772 RepID=A0A1V9YP22_ACHHY|nr:hypothetical protein ACHHYP_08865 [Achlya hypogyna]